jgi:hypothetical protein
MKRSRSPSVQVTELGKRVMNTPGLRKMMGRYHMELDVLEQERREYVPLIRKKRKLEKKLEPYLRSRAAGSISFLNPTRFNLAQAPQSILKAKKELDEIQRKLGKLTFKRRMALEKMAGSRSKSRSRSRTRSSRSKSRSKSKSKSKSRSGSRGFWRMC